jgi:hypothetical protein
MPAVDIQRHRPASGRADDHIRLVLVELGLDDADGRLEVVVGQGRVDDLVAVLSQEGRLDAAGNRVPAVEEEDFHWEHSSVNGRRANLISRCRVFPLMDTVLLNSKFTGIGARLKIADRPTRRRNTAGVISLDVQTDRKGEFFEIARRPDAEAEIAVLDVQRADLHLLLLVREGKDKSKFLCGHDERHWFVAGIPESAPVGTVRQAKEALKPAEIRLAQALKGLRASARSRRKNAAYVRQGEWFFLPVADLAVEDRLVLRNEPLTRGNGGKPHWAEFCYRTGGETVYVHSHYPYGISEADYRRLIADHPEIKRWRWRVMRRNAGVYVRGRIRHADHKAVVLRGWHRVLMNTENQSKAMRNVAFLD